MLIRPNFLLIGAAKSATTSIYYYLKEHPEVFMSSIKEPKFITSQFIKFPLKGPGDNAVEVNFYKKYNEYLSLFKGVKTEKAIGEASADTLYYHNEAVGMIKKYLGEIKILIILRNPVERAYSSWIHLYSDGRESLTFEKALEKETERIDRNWEFLWHYKNVGLYFKQVKNYLENFDSVKILLYDDIKKHQLKSIKNIYKFLDVDQSFIPNIEKKYNISGIPKNQHINKAIKYTSNLDFIKNNVNRVPFNDKIIQKIDILNRKNLIKPKMKKDTKNELIKYYYNDIIKLEALINRDLGSWLI